MSSIGENHKGSSNAKRSRSPAASPPKKASKTSAAAPATAKPKKLPAKATTVAHRSPGLPKRSAETLEQLAIKKTKEEIWDGVVPFKRLTTDKDFNPAGMIKLATWNVAGLRGVIRKDERCIEKLLLKEKLDVLCLQETKLNPEDADANAKLGLVPGYTFVDHPCDAKRGYSGVRTYIKQGGLFAVANGDAGLTATTGMTLPGAATPTKDDEGRVLTVLAGAGAPQAPTLALVNTYIPNSGMTLDRLEYRVGTFDPSLRRYLKALDDQCVANAVKHTTDGPVGAIWTGDLNVAEKDIDRYYAGTYKTMQECSGFTPEERASFRETLKECEAVDVFRALYPNSGPVSTFWSARIRGREKGLGWRIDYFVLPRRMTPLVVDCFPMPEVMGSDHCPMQLWLRTKSL